MTITAKVSSTSNTHEVVVTTNNNSQSVAIFQKKDGKGSAVNGGELLFASLATCFCNDIYREASRRNITIDKVEVNVYGEFGGEGEPAKSIHYKVEIESPSPRADIQKLIEDVDRIAEIHNTLRQGINVKLMH